MSGYLGLEGKRALVTGGTKGVGQAVVAALHDAGATVLTTARSRPESIRSPGQFVAADVSTAEGCAAVAQGARSEPARRCAIRSRARTFDGRTGLRRCHPRHLDTGSDAAA